MAAQAAYDTGHIAISLTQSYMMRLLFRAAVLPLALSSAFAAAAGPVAGSTATLGVLETTDLPVDEVAARSGLGSGASLRQHIRAAVGVSPSDYRRTFRG